MYWALMIEDKRKWPPSVAGDDFGFWYQNQDHRPEYRETTATVYSTKNSSILICVYLNCGQSFLLHLIRRLAILALLLPPVSTIWKYPNFVHPIKTGDLQLVLILCLCTDGGGEGGGGTRMDMTTMDFFRPVSCPDKQKHGPDTANSYY
jgi:hypothetical protein